MLLSTLAGVAAIGAGLALGVAFVVPIPDNLNNYRILLYFALGIVAVLGVHARQAGAAARAELLTTTWLIVALALGLGQSIADILGAHPFGVARGDAWFVVAVAWWLGSAAFAAATLARRVVPRWGPIALVIGSPLALIGAITPRVPALEPLAPIALAGIALHAIGWIAIGLWLVAPRRAAAAASAEV